MIRQKTATFNSFGLPRRGGDVMMCELGEFKPSLAMKQCNVFGAHLPNEI
nr:hypothetical protein [Candidatus Methylobacter oryzae]